MSGGSSANKGTVVMGTVEGDIHEIGKNVCCAMLRGAGYNVIDVGPDADSQTFLDAAEENDAKVLGGSALMTTTSRHRGSSSSPTTRTARSTSASSEEHPAPRSGATRSAQMDTLQPDPRSSSS